MTKRFSAAVGLLLCAAAAAQTASQPAPTIKSVEALSAKVRCDKSLTDAKAAYIKAMKTSYDDYVKVLDKARMEAFMKDNAAEVEALSKEKARVLAEIAALDGPTTEVKQTEVDVAANKAWTDAVQVKKGQTVEIKAEGSWCGFGPKEEHDANGKRTIAGYTPKIRDLVIPQVLAGALIAKVGSGEPFKVGVGGKFTMKEDGMLSFGPNAWAIGKNPGALKVTVTIQLIKEPQLMDAKK